ncbi:MAG TPA: YdhR family protein [Vicinamibacterales bacterium]|jgi:heme-degrading monooxygenase HmoA|nr:YdhR family protein [Vicinamibacterales bacterium]
MHVLIINFNLKGIDEAQYAKQCNEVAPAFAAVPGLISKVWLENSDTGTYGGVYLFEDRNALNRFQESDLFRSLAVNKSLTNVTANDFAVLEAPTRVTHGFLASVAS